MIPYYSIEFEIYILWTLIVKGKSDNKIKLAKPY